MYAFVNGGLRGRCSLASSLQGVRGGLFDPYRRVKLMARSGCKTPSYRTTMDKLRGTSTIACVYYSGEWV